MATLYELTAEYQALLLMAEDPDVDPETLRDTMDDIGGALEDKAEGYAKVMAELKASADTCRAESRRLTDRARVIENNIARMKSALQTAMELSGKRKFKTELFSFSIAKNPDALVVTDESRVPEEFLKAEIKVDKDSIKKALKDGQEFDWAHLEASEGLRIK